MSGQPEQRELPGAEGYPAEEDAVDGHQRRPDAVDRNVPVGGGTALEVQGPVEDGDQDQGREGHCEERLWRVADGSKSEQK